MKETVLKFTLRLNGENPQHARLNQVLASINADVYKSKNQFLIDAALFYIDHYGEKNITVNNECVTPSYVRREEFEALKQELMEKAMTEARNEVIRVLGNVVCGMRPMSPQKEQPVDNASKQVIEDSVMDELVAKWM